MIVGLTGGVACGKSGFGQEVCRRSSADYVDVDRLAKVEMTDNPEVRKGLIQAFGASVFLPDGNLARSYLRSLLFSNSDARRTLEAIVHPAVRIQWQALVEEARAAGTSLVVEIPLLYEVGAQDFFDAVAVVAASENLQIERMMNQRGLPEEVARKILASQMPISDKVQRADYVIWNDSHWDFLMAQAAYFADIFSRPNV
jgi:dephospho-CoA kinase